MHITRLDLKQHLQICEITSYDDKIEIFYYYDNVQDDNSELYEVSVLDFENWLKEGGRMRLTEFIQPDDSISVDLSSYTEYLDAIDWQVRYEDAKEYLIEKLTSLDASYKRQLDMIDETVKQMHGIFDQLGNILNPIKK